MQCEQSASDHMEYPVTIGDPFNPHRRLNGVFVPLGLLRCREIGNGAKLLYGRLCLFAGKDGECFAERSELGKEMGLSVASIGRQLEELVDAKFIRRVRRGRGQTALCQFLWHPALESCQRSAPDNAKVRCQKQGSDNAKVRYQRPSESAELRHQEVVQTAQECAPDSAILRHAIKEEKIPLKDSLTPASARESSPRREALSFPRRQQGGDWPCGGWEDSEDFELWWRRVVDGHPNKSRNGMAKLKALELALAGVLTRAEFDEGYLHARTAAGERWAEQHGRYAPNLWQFLDDMAWKFTAPAMPPVAEYQSAEEYLRRVENE